MKVYDIVLASALAVIPIGDRLYDAAYDNRIEVVTDEGTFCFDFRKGFTSNYRSGGALVDKAIPAGLYNVENGKSPKFKRELPLLYNKDVKASRGIRIHVGNDAVKDSSGCVLVGMGRKGDKLTESTPAETMVTMLCRNMTKLAIVEAVG